MKPLQLAILNLSRRKLPTLLAFLSITFAVAFSGTLLRLYNLSHSRFQHLARGGRAIAGAKAGSVEILLGALNLEGPYPDFIPLNLYASLRQKRNLKFEDGANSQVSVDSVIPLVYFGKFKDYRILGTDSSFFHRPESEDSLDFSEGREAQNPSEIVVGSEVAKSEHLKIGDTITVRSWTGDEVMLAPSVFQMKISGILARTEGSWDRGLYSTLDKAREVFDSNPLGKPSIWKSDVLHYFLIYLPPNGMEPLENLINRRTVAELASVEAATAQLRNWTGTGDKLGFMLSALLLLLGGLAVASMMATRFDGMTVQLSVLRALGYQKREIRNWLLWEGVLLGTSACLVGAILDCLLFPYLRNLLGGALPSESSIPIYQSYPVWGFALLSTMSAILIPLAKMYRQDVHYSLKG